MRYFHLLSIQKSLPSDIHFIFSVRAMHTHTPPFKCSVAMGGSWLQCQTARKVWRDLFPPRLLFHLHITRDSRGACLSLVTTHTLREIRYLLPVCRTEEAVTYLTRESRQGGCLDEEEVSSLIKGKFAT